MNPNIIGQFFPNATEEREMGICPVCKRAIMEEEFKGELDKKENKISGLCQSCIDGVFGN